MNSISFFKALLMKELNEKELSDKQKKIAKLDPPANKLDAGDFKKLRSMKEGDGMMTVHISDKRNPGGSDEDIKNSYNLIVKNRSKKGFDLMGSKQDIDAFVEDYGIQLNENYSKLDEKYDAQELEMMLKKLKKENPGKKVTYTFKKDSPKGYVFFIDKKLVKEGEDHEVSMAHNSLKSIVSSASQLMNLLGNDEKDIPAWIQDHITNAENFINQASKNYHEYNEGEHDMDELPDGTEELPAGDAEDAEMSLQGLMETIKGKKKRNK